MCNKCNKPFCLCLGDFNTDDIVKTYICKLSTVMYAEGTKMNENDFKAMQQLQHELVLWLNDVPLPHINEVIRTSTIIVMRHTHLFGTAT